MKRGSALLIVLGMLTFIVASAVGFSAYMRYARMPSSFLRRTSSSRFLVKAALTEAIDIIDNSIGNDAYPGQKGREFVKTYRRITDDLVPGDVIDYWQDRCFIGSNQLIRVEDTVSTLCTEALAYIPPPLINEVRYYSRRSLAGTWHTLGYDSGRFAFTAVDVSDFFDVNSVRATPLDIDGEHMYGRNSSDAGRITLAHVFENASHTGYNADCTPDRWDEFMDNYLDGGKLPLVSIADLNLAMGKQGLPDYMSPFCNYIRNGANFVSSETGPEAELVRNMTFVADGLFTSTNDTKSVIDLSQAKGQPFNGHQNGATLQQVFSDIDSSFLQRLMDRQQALGRSPEVVQLYDYLDEDSVPLSLAMPTVERTPMITAVGLEGELTIAASPKSEVKRTNTPGKPGVDFEFEKKTTELELRGNLLVSAGIVFPFKYKRPSEGTFKAQAALTVTFVPSEDDRLRRNAAQTVVEWANTKLKAEVRKLSDKPAYVIALSDLKTLSLPSKEVLTDEKDAVLQDVTFPFDLSGSKFTVGMDALASSPWTGSDDCSLRSVRKYRLIDNPNGGAPLRGAEVTADGYPSRSCGWLPVNAALDDVISGASFLDGSATCRPVVQVWVRVVDKDSKTVDLSPAYWEDDGLTGGSKCEMLKKAANGSAERPLLRFRAERPDDCKIAYDPAQDLIVVGAGNQVNVSDFLPKAYLAIDPRFNYAPENMVACNALDSNVKFKDYWLSYVIENCEVEARDGDIFMTTSDAGYLQSVYELAHIGMTSANGGKVGVMDDNRYDGVAKTDPKNCPAFQAIWKTYSQYDSGSGRGYLDGLGVVNGLRGFRVNPYSQSKSILMSAFANTPIDWWAAATNDAVVDAVHDTPELAAKYAFSEMRSGGAKAQVRMKYADLRRVADQLSSELRQSNASANWEKVFDNLPWDDDPDRFFGAELKDADGGEMALHAVDRKFLHGFWKECFANRQQLFLVFVRAEPMMMGGGGLGQTPPQLGGRAVALVWRDPAATRDDVEGKSTSGGPRPHRTRILFYRQFD